MKRKLDEHYTKREEKLNIATHMVGLIMFSIGVPILIYQAFVESNNNNVVCNIVYGLGLISVYGTSVLYHMSKDEVARVQFKLMDHICIFILIGGTYMPFISKFFDPPFSIVFLLLMWVLIIIGIGLKLFFKHRYNKIFSAVIYTLIGCMILFIINPVRENVPSEIIDYIAYGGFFYLSGILFYIWKKREFTHAIWHCFVLTGSIFHFIGVYKTLNY